MTGGSRCKALKPDCEISTGLSLFVSPVAFMLSKKTPLPSETSSSQEKYRSFTQRKLALKKAELAKTLEEIKITTVRATNIQCWDVGSKSIQLPWLPLRRKF